MMLLGTGRDGDLRTWMDRLHKNKATERDIEVPWAQAAINKCRGTWLDVGYARTEPEFWEDVHFTGERCVGLDFAIPDRPNPFDETIEADVTNYKFGSYDLITCISTLEHVGCDNTKYKAGEVRRENPIPLQQEVVRKLRDAGERVLASVPFGRFENHGWFVQYDLKMVEDLAPTEVAFYRLGGEKMEPAKLADCLYRVDELRAGAVALMEFT